MAGGGRRSPRRAEARKQAVVAGERRNKTKAVWEKGVARWERPRWQKVAANGRRPTMTCDSGGGGRRTAADGRVEAAAVVCDADGGVHARTRSI